MTGDVKIRPTDPDTVPVKYIRWSNMKNLRNLIQKYVIGVEILSKVRMTNELTLRKRNTMLLCIKRFIDDIKRWHTVYRRAHSLSL